MCSDIITVTNLKVLNIVAGYLDKHPSAKSVGGEYVYQDDEAQEDAIQMFAEICDVYAEEGEENGTEEDE
jgi:hypothetical protein